MAAAGLYALDNILPQIENDHKHARQLADAISTSKSEIFSIDPDLQTNILTIYVKDTSNKITTQTVHDRLLQITDLEVKAGIVDELGKGVIVKSCCWDPSTMKFVFYNQITDELTKLAIKKVIFVLNELNGKRF